MSNPSLFRRIDRGVFDYCLIENGDRILVGASGGKDSTVLLEYLSWRKSQHRESFEVEALHVSTEIAPPLAPSLIQLYKSWNIPLHIINVSVLERLKPGKKMNCWWCSTQRRTELNQFAIDNGFNKIALGHHLDDILETLLMNMIQKGELSTMPPRLKYRQYPITVIRPLCFCSVQQIINHAKGQGFLMKTCTCNYQDNSARKAARDKLSALTKNDDEKLKIFNSLRNVKKEYLTYPFKKGLDVSLDID